ncbi:MAG: hypothetical protein BIFFINMI_00959 [Phycisphaerae bacterium]|nr:hypothetical protein [Phycisphaerae bacterium]
MPRRSNVQVLSVQQLQAEIARRVAALPRMIEQRDRLNAEIAALQTLVNNAPTAGKKPGRKTAGRKRGRRGSYAQTADQFVLALLKGKSLTTADLTAAWKKAGRGGKVDNVLTKLAKAGQVKRAKVSGGQGSNYSLA